MKRLGVFLSLVAVTLLGVAAAGCGSGDSDGGGGVPTQQELDGKTFVSTATTGHDLIKDSRISASFDGENIAISAGCNRMFGPYELEDGRLKAEQLGSTMMACPEDLMDQDRWLQEFLAAGPEIGLEGMELTLTGDDATLLFEYRMKPLP